MASGHGLAETIRDVRDDLPDGLKSGSKDGLENTKRAAEGTLRSHGANYRGDTRKSLRIVSNDDGGYTLKAGGRQAPHAVYVEMGTGTHWKQFTGEHTFGPYAAPSFTPKLVAAIDEWVEQKGITADHVDEADLPWAIAHEIAESGTSRQPFMQPAFFTTRNKIKKNIRDGGNDAIERNV